MGTIYEKSGKVVLYLSPQNLDFLVSNKIKSLSFTLNRYLQKFFDEGGVAVIEEAGVSIQKSLTISESNKKNLQSLNLGGVSSACNFVLNSIRKNQ